MSEKTAKNDHDGTMMHKKRFALIAVLLISICIGMSWYGMHDANAQMKMHNSVDMVSTKWSGTWGGWGVTGGKYGQFTCATCHSSSTTNIKRIKSVITVPDITKGNIPGSAATVSFMTTSGGTAPMGQDALESAANARICHVCHSITTHNQYKTSGTQTAHKGTQDCTDCHSHKNAFSGGDCIGCHGTVQNSVRAAVVTQFNANSHHIQGVTLTNQHCYACHWEANADGSPNGTYHTQAANSPINLVVWGTSTLRPTVDSAATNTAYLASAATRTEYAKINSHCLGCHNQTNLSTTPFAGDSHDTHYYAWDGLSIDQRYSQPTGSTTWGKYATADSTRKPIRKAYSAHGNAANNQMYWDSTYGFDTMLTTSNFTGSTNVLCFDCHNSHGSTVTAVTTNYSSSTGWGGLLKDTTAGQGGYAVTYKSTTGGSVANKNFYNPGAGLCFDCHMETKATQTQHPWGYDTFGATSAIVGFNTSTYFGPTFNPMQLRSGGAPTWNYTFKQGRGTSKGGHFGASSAMSSAPTNSIKALCTPCHDPHGVSPTLNQAYSVPLLKGTWLTSPYQEDAAPARSTERRGGGSRTPIGFSFASTPGWHLDQNTFRARSTFRYTTVFGWPAWSVASKMTETDGQFAGLCLQCHKNDASVASIHTTTAGGWKTRDRIHNTVKGWAATSGTSSNVNNAVHAYSCSKCHAPHNSSQPRLMVTNCMDFRHRGRVASGGIFTGMTATGVRGAQGSSGTGNGRFPAGGGGYAGSASGKAWATNTGGMYFLGIPGTTRTGTVAVRACHDGAAGAAGFGAWPTIELWNSKTTW